MNSNLSPTVPNRRQVMIVAGEASGDLHGSRLITHMRQDPRGTGFHFFGIGGQAMRKAGVEIIVDAAQLSVVGITEVVVRLPGIWKGMSTARKNLMGRRPDLLILIDFPDFNLRLAAAARKAGIPVFYYITPQVWAWRRGRVRTIKERVDQVAVIFPFEESFFRAHGVGATFVGHPLLDGEYVRPEAEQQKNGKSDTLTIGLLPGSRNREVQRHLPAMLKAAEIINRRLTSVKFLISCADSVDAEALAANTDPFYDRFPFTIVTGNVNQVLTRSNLAVAVSGTVTLEAALFGVPMIIIYRVSAASYLLGKMLISVPHISLVNIVAEKEVVPELLQSAVTAANIADRICDLANNSRRYEKIREDLAALRKKLGGPGASARAAEIALNMLSAPAPGRKP